MTASFLRYISNRAICITFALILFLTLSYKTNKLEVVSQELRLFAVYFLGEEAQEDGVVICSSMYTYNLHMTHL